jgi:hypothetical protein
MAAYARGLYGFLRDLDQHGCDLIVASLPTEEKGWGLAIPNRLRRAAGPAIRHDRQSGRSTSRDADTTGSDKLRPALGQAVAQAHHADLTVRCTCSATTSSA